MLKEQCASIRTCMKAKEGVTSCCMRSRGTKIALGKRHPSSEVPFHWKEVRSEMSCRWYFLASMARGGSPKFTHKLFGRWVGTAGWLS